MMQTTGRVLIAELAIGLTVCLAGYLLVVEPTERRLAQVRGQIAAAEAEARAAQASALEPQQARAALRTARASLQEIERQGRTARDESALYAGITSLAKSHRIRIDHVQPTSGGVVRAPEKTEPGGAPPPRDLRSGYALAVTGEYADLVSFLTAMGEELGYSQVRSVRLTPSGEPGSRRVQAVVRTEHFAFEVRSLASGEGTGAAGAGGEAGR
jgi:Tfp pilus assembly protein PilO